MLVQFQQILRFYQSFRLRLDVKYENVQHKRNCWFWFDLCPLCFFFFSNKITIFFHQRLSCVYVFSLLWYFLNVRANSSYVKYFSNYLHVNRTFESCNGNDLDKPFKNQRLSKKNSFVKYLVDCLLCPKQFHSFWVGGARPEVNSWLILGKPKVRKYINVVSFRRICKAEAVLCKTEAVLRQNPTEV